MVLSESGRVETISIRELMDEMRKREILEVAGRVEGIHGFGGSRQLR
jgi:hypothetical protein